MEWDVCIYTEYTATDIIVEKGVCMYMECIVCF